MTDREQAKKHLIDNGCTCVLVKGETLFSSYERGVKPLYIRWKDNASYIGFSAADKVVGRATAFLYVTLGIKALYASVISRPAYALLTDKGIDVLYDTLVDNIINRKGDGICPFEAAVLRVDTPKEAVTAIEETMKELGISP